VIKKAYCCLGLCCLLLAAVQPARAADTFKQLQAMQLQIQSLRDDVKQKQQQMDQMQHQLEQLMHVQQMLMSDLTSSSTSNVSAAKPNASADKFNTSDKRSADPASAHAVASQQQAGRDDEVLFMDSAVFATDKPTEAWPGWLNTFNINGNIALRYEAGSNQQFNQGFTDTFRLSDFNLDFSFAPTAQLNVGLGLQMQELKVKNPVRQGLKIDSNSQFKHQFVIEYAFADYVFQQWFQLRFGAFLTPFGVYNESLHTDYDSKLVERPFLSEEIIPAPWTQLGIQLHGAVVLTPAWEVNYAVYTGNGIEALQDKNGIIKSSRIKDMTHQLVSRFNSNRAVGSRVGVLVNDGQQHFEMGISTYHGAWDPMATLNLNMLGSDVWYHYKGLDLRAEWALAVQDVALGKQYDYSWYTQAAYRWHLLEPVLRFDRLRNRYFNQNGPIVDDRHRYTLGLNIYLGKFFVLKNSYSESIFSVAQRHDHRFVSTLTAGF